MQTPSSIDVATSLAVEHGEVTYTTIAGHPYTLAAAMAFAAIHLLAPHCRRLFASYDRHAYSLAGGMAVAYAILILLPEFEYIHGQVGNIVYPMVLAGLVGFYALELYLLQRRPSESRGSDAFRMASLHIGTVWLYTWGIIYAMPDQVLQHGAMVYFSVAAIGMHLVYKDYLMSVHHDEAYLHWGRYLLASAPLIAWGMGLMLEPSEFVSDLIVALLAGYLLQNVFRNEIPDDRASCVPSFALGAVLFGVPVAYVLHLL
ncbi:hypothetical protein THITH_03295 [Thioalkalivibrio paradoxus ARh 1]|uniref:Uncharacterized protein n=2 Tax=Thioalkalivibrio paradoxus TaxID=108010 RepID=W0DMT4_9GAMM|nr:hypothetical protein THITH_03295 [Thioalkalivibrio paradoxus ARh 1]